MKGHQANILDPIHPGLSELLFDKPLDPEPHLKAKHRHWIVRTVTQALEQAGYEHVKDWLSLVLTGSLTTYQYSEQSDVDVSLFVNADKFPDWSRAEMIAVMVSKIDGTRLPGTPYPMQCFVVPPEISRQALYRPGLRSGYDLDADVWIVPPERDRVRDVKAEQKNDYIFALECADKMEKLLKYEPSRAVMYWHQIHNRRRRDQQAGKGDYAQSNIVYKELANRGLFPEIAEVSGEYIAKTAMAERTSAQQVMYHVSPQENHESIMAHGLDAARNPRGGYIWTGDVQGQYLFGNKGSAVQAAKRDFTKAHVYAVDVSGLAVERDPRMPDAHVVKELVGPERIALHGATDATGIYEGKTWPELEELRKRVRRQVAAADQMEPKYVLDQIAVDKAASHLGIQNPVNITLVGGTHGRYLGLINGKHEIEAIWWLNPKRANFQIWHELTHALQAEQGMEFNPRPERYDEYRSEPHEVEADRVASTAPFSVVTPTRTAAPKQRIVRKFVYNAETGELKIGDLGPEEGALPSHNQLGESIGLDFVTDRYELGTINQHGYVSFERGKGDYQTRAAAELALKQALPNEITRFIGGEVNHLFSPKWDFAQSQPGVTS